MCKKTETDQLRREEGEEVQKREEGDKYSSQSPHSLFPRLNLLREEMDQCGTVRACVHRWERREKRKRKIGRRRRKDEGFLFLSRHRYNWGDGGWSESEEESPEVFSRPSPVPPVVSSGNRD